MFSNASRCIYRRNQLANVICQLRFPDILSINRQEPAEFQEAIRADFPIYSAKQERQPPKLVGAPGNLQVENQPTTMNYQFASVDGVWQVNLTSKFISLSCSKYTCWEDFAKRLDTPLAAFIKVYKPACFQRIGLRYINIFSKKDLELEDVPFRSMFAQQYLGVLALDDVQETTLNRCSLDTELAIPGGCQAKIHAGTGRVNRNGVADKEIKYIFDQDLFLSGNIPVNYSAGALQTLHGQANPIFRGAITTLLHNAMEPEMI